MTKDICERVGELLEESDRRGRFLKSENFIYLDQITEDIENPEIVKSTVRGSSQHEGIFYSMLEDIGLLENLSNSRYLIRGEADEFREVRGELEERLDVEEVSPRETDLRSMMSQKDKSTEAMMRKIDEDPDTPSPWTFIDEFEQYNTALHEAGLTPNMVKRPDNELEAALTELYHGLGRRPSGYEIQKFTGIQPRIYEERYGKELDEIMDDLGLLRYEDLLDLAYEDYFGSDVSLPVESLD